MNRPVEYKEGGNESDVLRQRAEAASAGGRYREDDRRKDECSSFSKFAVRVKR
jgi:hypothetical protein